MSNMHKYDHGAKETTIRCYNESSHLTGEKRTTSNEIEVQLDQIKQMDVGNYLEERDLLRGCLIYLRTFEEGPLGGSPMKTPR